MRDEDEGRETLHDNPHYPEIQKSFNARCTESNSATNASDGVDYVVGTMVWTLFDCKPLLPAFSCAHRVRCEAPP